MRTGAESMPPDDIYIRTEIGNMETALSLLEELLGENEWSARERITVGALLQSVYGGLERLFRCLLAARGVGGPKGEKWHKELLQQALERHLVPESTRDPLRDMLLFRHMHVHGYGHMLEEDRLRTLANQSLTVSRTAIAALRNR